MDEKTIVGEIAATWFESALTAACEGRDASEIGECAGKIIATDRRVLGPIQDAINEFNQSEKPKICRPGLRYYVAAAIVGAIGRTDS